MSESLLIVENDITFSEVIARHFAARGWEVDVVHDLAGARRRLIEESRDPLLVLAETTLPDGNALDLLEFLRQQGEAGHWVVMSGRGGIPETVRALRLGADDVVEKPCGVGRLDDVLSGARQVARAQRRLRGRNAAADDGEIPSAFLGRSEAAQRVRQYLSRLKDVPFSSLIITGDTGTGKGLVARILHHAGARSDGPMVEVNCAALPRDLLESELFGHEIGAFTGARGRHRGYLEQADGGTLFLDEIGEMDLDLQTKLLTAIEDRRLRRLGGERAIRVDVQVIAASNRDLEEAVTKGRFRRDLYHRLSVFRLDLPPLRERLDDLEDLVPMMIAEFNVSAGRGVTVVPQKVYRTLRQYHWPGNIRELRNVVERAVLLADGDVFPDQWLQLGNRLGREPSEPSLDGDRVTIPLDGSMALDEIDRYIIQTVLEKRGYNIAATARSLGTTRETLRYRIGKYKLRTAPMRNKPTGTGKPALH